MIQYLLLDLDNTVYPESSGLGRFMGARMGEFMVRHLDVSHERAVELRRSGLARHGTTLKWLIQEHDLTEIEEFIEFVHPTNLGEFLTDEDRRAAQDTLDEIDLPASILTNAPKEHAERVLRWLGIRGRFEHVFDIRFNSLAGKPALSAYSRALENAGAEPGSTLFADDVLQYLLPFRDLGGHAVHVAAESAREPGISTIGSIAELVSIIQHLRSGQ
ncbi:MAG: pyrimidine 5'-nucleotidase [Spirochaetales bacterium]|nr:pyrimidine 5'-nucleotidase [Spirochaetales bacterium]